MNRSKLLAVVALVLVNMAFIMAVTYNRFQPQWIATYIAVVLLYFALHFRRSTDLPEGLRRRFGKAAITLVLFLTAMFFYNFASGLPWWVAGASWLGLVSAAYFFYGIVFFEDDEEEEAVLGAEEKEWYFFCLRGRKYRNSIRPNRVTGSGFWKATGIDKPVHDGAGAGECVGLKKSLVYYRGSAGRGTKTDWMMHEFRLPSTSSADFQDAEIWTICRIFKRKLSYNRRFQQQIKQEQGSNKRISHQLQKQLEYNHHHQLFYTGCASMASSFESTTTDVSEASHAIDHSQPFLLHSHSLHGASPEDMMKVKKPATSPSAVAWSELTSFVQDGGSTWDELGRILEIEKLNSPQVGPQSARSRRTTTVLARGSKRLSALFSSNKSLSFSAPCRTGRDAIGDAGVLDLAPPGTAISGSRTRHLHAINEAVNAVDSGLPRGGRKPLPPSWLTEIRLDTRFEYGEGRFGGEPCFVSPSVKCI
ncbi:hypothetical protein PR202_gb24344 [Eleusine coracana subsp. coracana]|uniref:NAC domain-containing protein n=1 Tax=Eleusine coracana subsp. coracana TaxID=191504 RepID=A0AAV5FLD0_ELECO|nr:hypothetical protein PR202_gb24344 [Eleusine coracana subsp. coracana]